MTRRSSQSQSTVQVIALRRRCFSRRTSTATGRSRVAIIHHAIPYRVAPSAYPGDPAYGVRVRDPPDGDSAAYGPALEALGTVPAAGGRIIARPAEMALPRTGRARRAGRAPRRRAPDPQRAAVALLGWSPLVALHFAGGAHNDAWIDGAARLRRRSSGFAAAACLARRVGLQAGSPRLVPLHSRAVRFGRADARWCVGLVAAALVVAGLLDRRLRTHWIAAAPRARHRASLVCDPLAFIQLGHRHRSPSKLAGLAFLPCTSAWLTIVLVTSFIGRDPADRASASSASTSVASTTEVKARPLYLVRELHGFDADAASRSERTLPRAQIPSP